MTKGFKTAVAVAGGLAMTLAFGVVSPAAASTAPTEPPGSAAAPAELNNGENVTLKLLADNSETTSLLTAGVTAAFSALHPNVTFDIEQRPGGTDGDNIVKTRLATDEMADVFFYNSGSLLQALNPTETIVDLTGDPMLDNVVDAFIPTVSQGDGVFGVPFGTGHRRRHPLQPLDLRGPGAVGADDVGRLRGQQRRPARGRDHPGRCLVRRRRGRRSCSCSPTSTTSPRQCPTSPSSTRPTRRTTPTRRRRCSASSGFSRATTRGWWNEDYGSATYEDAQQMLADGDIAQYPMLTFALAAIAALDPEAAQNIGFFAQPGPERRPTA